MDLIAMSKCVNSHSSLTNALQIVQFTKSILSSKTCAKMDVCNGKTWFHQVKWNVWLACANIQIMSRSIECINDTWQKWLFKNLDLHVFCWNAILQQYCKMLYCGGIVTWNADGLQNIDIHVSIHELDTENPKELP